MKSALSSVSHNLSYLVGDDFYAFADGFFFLGIRYPDALVFMRSVGFQTREEIMAGYNQDAYGLESLVEFLAVNGQVFEP